MSEIKFPPAPWSRNIPPANKYPVVWSGRNKHVAALARGLTDEEAEAAIDLIAAAPDLYEALVSARQQLEQYEAERTGEAFNDTKINAALAKARGEPT